MITAGVITGQLPLKVMGEAVSVAPLAGVVMVGAPAGIGAGTVADTSKSSALAARSIATANKPETITIRQSAQYDVCR